MIYNDPNNLKRPLEKQGLNFLKQRRPLREDTDRTQKLKTTFSPKTKKVPAGRCRQDNKLETAFSPKKPAGRCRQDKEFQTTVFGRIFYEWGPGESVWALDQDVDNYIDWLWGFIRQKHILVCSGWKKIYILIYIYIYIIYINTNM